MCAICPTHIIFLDFITLLQWNVSITKSCGWRNYIRYNEISLQWNTLKCHRCLHRRFSRAVAIESNESWGPLRVYIGRSESHGHRTAGRIQSLKCLHFRLSFRFHSTEIATNELVNVVMYRQIISRVENADVYTCDLVVRQQSNRTKGVFLPQLNRNARRLITSKHGFSFQFWSCG
jgi:hypothetical protein